jgi:thymidylate synthase (FAD)
MKVKILHYTPIKVMIQAARTATGIFVEGNERDPANKRLINRIINLEHDSVLEHVVYSIKIEGISRALLQQWSRHRHVSQTVESTRYSLKRKLKELQYAEMNPQEQVEELFVIPDGAGFDDIYWREVYLGWLTILEDITDTEKNDVAKYFIPECLKTSLVATVNARELDHIITLRSQPNALPEFQKLVKVLEGALLGLPCEWHRYIWTKLAERRRCENVNKGQSEESLSSVWQ